MQVFAVSNAHPLGHSVAESVSQQQQQRFSPHSTWFCLLSSTTPLWHIHRVRTIPFKLTQLFMDFTQGSHANSMFGYIP